MRKKLSEVGIPETALKVLTESMMGNKTLRQMGRDPELYQYALQRNRELAAQSKRGGPRKPKDADFLARVLHKQFRDWLPEYFESAGDPELGQNTAKRIRE